MWWSKDKTTKRTEYGKQIRKGYEQGEIKEQRKYMQRFEPRTDGVSNTLTSVQKDNMVAEPSDIPLNEYADGTARTIKAQYQQTSKANLTRSGSYAATGAVRVPSKDDQQGTSEMSFRIRKLTPRECFRLMGVSETDIDKIQAYRDEEGKPISRSQQYKMAGNSIVVDVMAKMFTNLFDKDATDKIEPTQLTLF